MKRAFFAALFAAAFLLPAAAQDTPEREVRLPETVRPVHYAITTTPNAETLSFTGEVRIDVNVEQPTREIVLNTLELEWDGARIDGRTAQVRFNADDQTAHLTSQQLLAVGRHTIEVSYRGRIYRQAQGLFAQDYAVEGGGQGRMLVSQFQAADARRFVPSFDEPMFRATFDMTVIAPRDRVVISNMPELSSENIDGDLKRVRFATSPNMSTYLLFLGVGDFERISQTIAGVEVSIITKRGDSERGRFALQAAAEVLPWFNEYFGTPYPLPKLDIIAAPGGGGFAAMENWGAILFFEQFLLVNPETTSEALRQFIYTTVAHEIAHMWFGNLVTMQWWDDTWLNEGFASWIENKVTDHFHPDWQIWEQQGQRQAAMLLDARTTSHPIIVPIANVEQANQAFDQITYQKGYAVIRMYEEFVGEDAFRSGVREYMRRHAYGNTRSVDLWDAIEQASGLPLRQVADDFTRQPGIPLISVGSSCRGRQQTLTLNQSEFTSPPADRPARLWHTPVAGVRLGGAAQARALTGASRTAELTLPGRCGDYIVNPGQIGYYRVQYPRADFDRLVRNFARAPISDQLGLLYDTRALGRAGNVPMSDFFRLARAAPRDADPLVWAVIAGEVAAHDGLFNDDDPRRTAWRNFGRSLLNPVLARVGWDRVDGEPDNNSILRATLLGAMSALEDPAFEAEALRRYREGRIGGPIRSTVMAAVGAAATLEVFEELLGGARAATDTLERRLAYQALANVRDPSLAQRVLELAFAEDVDASLSTTMIGIVAATHQRMAFDYAMAHQSELAERLDPFTLRVFPAGLGGGTNDAEMLRLVRSYIDDNVPATARRAPEAQYAALEERIVTRERRLNEVSAWLGSGRGR